MQSTLIKFLTITLFLIMMTGFIIYRMDYFNEEDISILDLKREVNWDVYPAQSPPPDSAKKTKTSLVFDSLSEEEKERFFMMSSSKSFQVIDRENFYIPTAQPTLDSKEVQKTLMPSSKVAILPTFNKVHQFPNSPDSVLPLPAESLFQFIDTAQ